MDDFKAYIESYHRMVEAHVESIRTLLSDKQVRDIGSEFRESKKSRTEQSLNVFKMVSDLYYRENFHSDVLKVFLDPREKHKEGAAFLFAFIDFINDNFRDKVYISKQDYRSAKAKREQGKIDILIMSEESKHCIIIENKIYNAPDMERQLPKYYDYMIERGYKVDAIVYLPLDINKQPNQMTWLEEDKKHVLPLLCIVPAYQKKGVNLVAGWIEPCILKARNLDCVSILRQYGELVKLLNNNIMDNIILGKFYQSLKDGKSMETALSVRNMLQDLPAYMADRLCETFEVGQSDYRVWKWKPNFCGILFQIGDIQYKIDIWTSENGYEVKVLAHDHNTRYVDWAEGMASIESFTFVNDEYKKTGFTFYDEEKVIECVTPIIAEMRERLFKK